MVATVKSGNIEAQKKRHRENNRGVAKRKEYYLTIDGNPTRQPFAYCIHYKAYLTRNQSMLHKCRKRQCKCFETFEDHLKYLENKEIKNLQEYPWDKNS